MDNVMQGYDLDAAVCQIGKAITGERTKELLAIIDLTIAIAIHGQKSGTLIQLGHFLLIAIGIQIEVEGTLGKTGYQPIEIEHQRIFEFTGTGEPFVGAEQAIVQSKAQIKVNHLAIFSGESSLGAETDTLLLQAEGGDLDGAIIFRIVRGCGTLVIGCRRVGRGLIAALGIKLFWQGDLDAGKGFY